MRVVYLDFDGVISTIPDTTADSRQPDAPLVLQRSPGVIADAASILNPACVANVDRLCLTLDAAVVVSSSWRRAFSLDELRAILKGAGLVAEVIGVTPMHGHRRSHRGTEIAADMDARGLGWRDVVILDDDDDMEPLVHRLVRTEMFGDNEGFNDEALRRALALFAAREAAAGGVCE